MNGNQKPVFETKLRQIRASVFKNTDKNGNPFYNTQLVRRYQSGDNEWSNSSHFTGKADLLLARQLIDEAVEFISQQAGTGGGL
ncbi:hypothetical protein [Rubinisphaera brasiliensis]|uniref:Uncharacterized protein n=1 Tax=Rubinisphaera brasiliensis (strain ATCC 49424 / DSM 5305 / JCM 21570 / IAM 15109 / NBRC 103401 / IFAM 1448) TaxID=756272 RepID=F0SS20_RUBBR|nr:hypothetical protein [Rubinisphaera brasiliensis]ADY61358.1 hypothetical protein Plabr_3768 [Rubinisphaera brasiliensis DSM 5305]